MKLAILLCAICMHGAYSLPDTEVQALKDLHEMTHGATWRKNHWESIDPRSACTLPGVSCRNDHVTELSLEHSFSGGVIPDSISALSYLRVIDMGSNFLSGSLPGSLGNLKHLEQFEADSNHFTGHLPADWEALRSNDCDECVPRQGASTGGARVFLGFNTRSAEGVTRSGWECPYPKFLSKLTNTSTPGSSVATGWGLPRECGLTAQDVTPDEEDTVSAKAGDEEHDDWDEHSDQHWDEDRDAWEEDSGEQDDDDEL